MMTVQKPRRISVSFAVKDSKPAQALPSVLFKTTCAREGAVAVTEALFCHRANRTQRTNSGLSLYKQWVILGQKTPTKRSADCLGSSSGLQRAGRGKARFLCILFALSMVH